MTQKQTILWAILLAPLSAWAASQTDTDSKGLIRHDTGVFEGYTLFAPLQSANTYLIDMQGRVVHTWQDEGPPGQSVYLLENGHLLRTGRAADNRNFHGGGLGGLIREFDWDGNLVWEYKYADDRRCQHHDVEPLPNGNVLILAWEHKTRDQAIAAGRDPDLLDGDELWPDHIIEVQPQRPRGGQVVWEWHVWDHLIQDHDPNRANYGVVAEHPELIDVNYVPGSGPLPPDELARLEALGYIGGTPRPGPRGRANADWNHCNSIDYNAQLDQIALSVLHFNEIWVIDHSTTTNEAAGNSGGRYGRGGDLLYRWGNPQAHRAGTAADQTLFAQHDARWIPSGLPGGGHVLVFNNGRGRLDGEYSSVDEIKLPILHGEARTVALVVSPAQPVWRYAASSRSEFFSGHISGAHRLPNGNTLVCSGEQGRLFEVTREGRIVWEYLNPFGGDAGPPGRRRGDWHPPLLGPPDGGQRRPPHRWGRPPRARGRGPGRRGGGPPGGHEQTAIFRATRIPKDHPALAGKDLSPKPVSPESPSTANRPPDRPPGD